MSHADDGDWSVEVVSGAGFQATCWCRVMDGKIVETAALLRRNWLGKPFSKLRRIAHKVHKLNVGKKAGPNIDSSAG